MSFSTLPLSYCTNVHSAQTAEEVEAGLVRYTVPIRDRFGAPLAAGLWLASPVTHEILSHPDGLSRFGDVLVRRGVVCHTLNAFPYGNFHAEQVKQNVYLPDWSDPARLRYTKECARVLSAIASGNEGSISTLPLGFKYLPQPRNFMETAIEQLIDCAEYFAQLHNETGKLIRLAIEPEPLCILETTDEAIAFFAHLREAADRRGCAATVATHLGLCYDVCHQAVEFEDIAASIAAIDRAGIRINKIHISCAIQLDNPIANPAGREALATYVEPRYLHQTTAQLSDGRIVREIDLSSKFVSAPPTEFAAANAWRIHFHVPVDADTLGPLATTKPALRQALAAIGPLSYAPHLEVETYTWQVLPGAGKADVVAGLARELTAATGLIAFASGKR